MPQCEHYIMIQTEGVTFKKVAFVNSTSDACVVPALQKFN